MAKNDGAGAGAGAERGAGGCGAGTERGAGSGLNRPLTARSNLTFHSTDFITYIVRVELSSAVYSFGLHSFSFRALALSLVQTLPTFYIQGGSKK